MGKKSVDTDRGTDQVAVMKANGYLPAAEVAKRLGVSRQTLARWAEDGAIDAELVAHRRYINVRSLVDHIGAKQARLFGFLKKKAEGEAHVEDSQDQ